MIHQLKVFVLCCLVEKTKSPMESKLLRFFSSYITLAINIFKQTKTSICVMVYIEEKVWLFEMKVPFL